MLGPTNRQVYLEALCTTNTDIMPLLANIAKRARLAATGRTAVLQPRSPIRARSLHATHCTAMHVEPGWSNCFSYQYRLMVVQVEGD